MPDLRKSTKSILPDAPLKTWLLRLSLLYAFFCAVYIVLAFFVRNGPVIIIDESLYTNLARSLAFDGEIAYRSQPVPYPYILYPLLLVPLYRLHALIGGAFDIYRMVQIFNVLLICSSAFPVFLFANDFCRNQKKAFIAAALTLLRPDMLMSFYEITESLIWPLSLWMIFFAYRMLSRKNEYKWYCMTGLFSGLLYCIKPGAVAMGASIIVVSFIRSLIQKRTNIKQLLSAAGTLLAVIVGLYAAYCFLFGYEFSFLALYEKQTSDWAASHALAAVIGTFLMIFGFIFACGGVFAILPYCRLKVYDEDQHELITSSTLGLFAAIIGTAVMVIPYMWNGDYSAIPLQLRYVAMYLPVWFCFSIPAFSGPNAKESSFSKKGFKIALAVFAVLSIYPGARQGIIRGTSNVFDSISLIPFFQNRFLNGAVTGPILTAVVVALTVILFFWVRRDPDERVFKLCARVFAAILIFSTVCGCFAASVPISDTVNEDAIELNHILLEEDSRPIGITQRMYNDIRSYWQEAHQTYPMQQITLDQLFSFMVETSGVYEPMIPVDQAPNRGNGLMTDTDVLVFGESVVNHIQFNDNVQTVTTKNGIYTVAYITPSERWVNSMIFGLDGNSLEADGEAVLGFFDEAETHDVTISFQGTPETTITITAGGYDASFNLESSDVEKYNLTFPYDLVKITANTAIEIPYFSSKPAE